MTKQWLREHFSDQYVKRAQKEGYASRAAYKLLEIQEKDRILSPGMKVVELGAAPGGWTKVVANIIGKNGAVVAVDLLPMQVPSGVIFLQGNFTQESTFTALQAAIEAPVDVVLSDMAPNISGMKSVDQPRSMHLIDLAWDCARHLLKKNGVFLCKIFQGSGVEEFIKEMRQHFREVKIRKPGASRARSSEIYLLAKGFLGYTNSQ